MRTATHAGQNFRLSSLWTASRGSQVINCELIVPTHGYPVIRCGYGPESIIRSQLIVSPEAASAVSETWKVAILAQGYRLDPDPPRGN
jgi:hypothetical protein